MSTPAVPDKKALALADRYVQDAAQTKNYAFSTTLDGSDESMQWATDAAKQIREIKRQVKGELDAICKPLRGVIKVHTDRFKPAIDDLDEAERHFKREIQRCMDERAEEQRKALAEAKTQEELERSVAAVAAKPAGFTERTTWDAEVIDETKVPAKFWILNIKAIERDVRKAKGQIEIPGVRVIERKIAGIR